MIPAKYYNELLNLEPQYAISFLVRKEKLDKALAEKEYKTWRKLLMQDKLKVNLFYGESKPKNTKNDKKIIEMYSQGMTMHQIAKELKTGVNTVRSRLNDNGIESRKRGTRGGKL